MIEIDTWKYIIFDGPSGFDGVIFPPHVKHSSMNLMIGWKPLSAGFIRIRTEKEAFSEPYVYCYGESTSLQLKSQEGDERAFQFLIK